jgi:preprotein translocase subunit SecG
LVQEGFVSVMTFLLYVLIVLHVIISLFLIGVVLLQTGKSADLAGAFGGQGSQTAFGPRGAANLLTKMTTYAAVLFMLTSVGLTIVLSRTSGATHSVLTDSSTPGKK